VGVSSKAGTYRDNHLCWGRGSAPLKWPEHSFNGFLAGFVFLFLFFVLFQIRPSRETYKELTKITWSLWLRCLVTYNKLCIIMLTLCPEAFPATICVCVWTCDIWPQTEHAQGCAYPCMWWPAFPIWICMSFPLNAPWYQGDNALRVFPSALPTYCKK
jgi:hypothetical protein